MAKAAKVEGVAVRQSVSMNDFISAWMKVESEGGSNADVAKLTGLKVTSVAVRASQYRKDHGIQLPALKGAGRGRKLNVTEANDLVKALAEKYAAEKAAKSAS